PNPLQLNGLVFENNFSEWTPLAADVIEGVNQVLWEEVATDALWTWNTNDVWSFEGVSGPVAPGTPEYQALLDAFGVDASALG
ncbi:MAG: hypothetical protein VKJ27_07520, partial [Synechocystis sp.]|nr:hypothetical protein [Synechocystis sp.]